MKESETLGEFLKRERELKKISLRELAQKTKVRERFLKAIEEDKFEVLPSPAYMKGFLSAYAKSIGHDPHEILVRYERSLKKEPVLASEAKSEKKSERKPEKKLEKKHEKKPTRKPGGKPEREPFKRFILSRKQIGIVSGVIAISFVISYFLHPYLSGPPESPPLNKTETREAASIVTIPEIPVLPPEVDKKPFLLEIEAIEETWIKAKINDQPQTEALLKPGERISYQATDRIELLIGNAGGLDMVFNGRRMERVGKSGEVAALVFAPQGVERKRP